MALSIILDDGRQDVVISTKRLWLTADRDRVVEDGDAAAAFLLVGEGSSLSRSDAERYGLIAAQTVAGDDAGLSGMTVAALREMADDLGIDHSGLKKAGLVAALEAATSTEPSPDDGGVG